MKSRAKAEKIPRQNKSFNKFIHSCREQLRVVKRDHLREKNWIAPNRQNKRGSVVFIFQKWQSNSKENKGSGTGSVDSLKIESLVAIKTLALFNRTLCLSIYSCYVAPSETEKLQRTICIDFLGK